MQRRDFLRTSLAVTAATQLPALVRASDQNNQPANSEREYYEVRAYRQKPGASFDLLHHYLEHAFLPALSQRGIHGVGVFTEMDPKDEPAVWVTIAYPTLAAVADVTANLNADAAVRAAAGDYWKSTSKDHPAFDRMDSWLLLAFAGHPKLTVPAVSRQKQSRIFELRTYDSFNEERAFKKVEMFNSGEIPTMEEVGLGPVFFGQGLVGRDLPHLTYMLSGADRASHADHWKGFQNHPVWVKLKNDPQYADTVSKVTSRFLVPTAYSPL